MDYKSAAEHQSEESDQLTQLIERKPTDIAVYQHDGVDDWFKDGPAPLSFGRH